MIQLNNINPPVGGRQQIPCVFIECRSFFEQEKVNIKNEKNKQIHNAHTDYNLLGKQCIRQANFEHEGTKRTY